MNMLRSIITLTLLALSFDAFAAEGISLEKSRISALDLVVPVNNVGWAQEIKVTLFNTNGSPVMVGGEMVQIRSTRGQFVGSCVDYGNGTYSMFLRTPAQAGMAIVSAYVNGKALKHKMKIYFVD